MNSPYSKIKHAFWLLKQLKRLHHRYRFRKMLLMSIPVMLIVFTYLGIQFKDLYQLKYLQLSNQQAENTQEESQFEELPAPKVNLASNSLSLGDTKEDNSAFDYSEEDTFSDAVNEEFLSQESTLDTFEETITQSAIEEKDGFIAGLPEKTLELEILRIDEHKLAHLRAQTVQTHIPVASPSLLTFKPVPFVRIPLDDLLTEVDTKLEETYTDPFVEGEDQ